MLFNVSGGTAAPDFGSTGAIILDLKNSGATFGASFNFSGGTADTLGVVPEPTAMVMLCGCGAIAVLFSAMHRRSAVG